jgi:hypothetical protein
MLLPISTTTLVRAVKCTITGEVKNHERLLPTIETAPWPVTFSGNTGLEIKLLSQVSDKTGE